jgi:hypothetical protein
LPNLAFMSSTAPIQADITVSLPHLSLRLSCAPTQLTPDPTGASVVDM